MYGRLGHRKTNCPYSVRAPVPEPCPDAPSGVNGGKDSALVREEGSQHGPSEEEYSPWVLVTRKRSSPKIGSKRVDGTSFNASRSQDFYPVDNTIKLQSRTHGTVDASIIRDSLTVRERLEICHVALHLVINILLTLALVWV